MLNEMDKVQTVDLSIHFQNGAIYDTMPLMGVNVSQYFGRWLDFGCFMDVSYMWENMSSSAYTAAEKYVTVKTANR